MPAVLLRRPVPQLRHFILSIAHLSCMPLSLSWFLVCYRAIGLWICFGINLTCVGYMHVGTGKYSWVCWFPFGGKSLNKALLCQTPHFHFRKLLEKWVHLTALGKRQGLLISNPICGEMYDRGGHMNFFFILLKKKNLIHVTYLIVRMS